MYLSTSSRPQLSLQDAENTDIVFVFVGHCSRTAFLASCECLRLSVDGNEKFFFENSPAAELYSRFTAARQREEPLNYQDSVHLLKYTNTELRKLEVQKRQSDPVKYGKYLIL